MLNLAVAGNFFPDFRPETFDPDRLAASWPRRSANMSIDYVRVYASSYSPPAPSPAPVATGGAADVTSTATTIATALTVSPSDPTRLADSLRRVAATSVTLPPSALSQPVSSPQRPAPLPTPLPAPLHDPLQPSPFATPLGAITILAATYTFMAALWNHNKRRVLAWANRCQWPFPTWRGWPRGRPAGERGAGSHPLDDPPGYVSFDELQAWRPPR